MIKFNVGDRVKLVKVDVQDEKHDLKVGMVGTVKETFREVNRVSSIGTIAFDNWHKGWGKNDQCWILLNYQLEKLEGESK